MYIYVYLYTHIYVYIDKLVIELDCSRGFFESISEFALELEKVDFNRFKELLPGGSLAKTSHVNDCYRIPLAHRSAQIVDLV